MKHLKRKLLDRYETLGKLRYKVFSKLIATATTRPQPEKLPPTDRAAMFHILRCHLQAVIWQTLNNDVLDPLQWGWQLEDNNLQPITTDQPPAPDDLLKIIRCKCKTECKSALCSCRRNGLKCVTACAVCHGQDCTNVEEAAADDTEELWMDSDVDWICEEVIEQCDADEVYLIVVLCKLVVKKTDIVAFRC